MGCRSLKYLGDEFNCIRMVQGNGGKHGTVTLIWVSARYAIPNLNLSDLRVFFINIVMVMGPTPPGTGVI